MKKVLILVNHDVVIYNFRRELVERLLHDGYEVYISSPYGERIDDLISMGCKYIEASIERHGTNIIEELKLISYYKRIIKDIKPDIVLSYTIKPNIYGGMACKILHVPYIANITGLGTSIQNAGIMQKIFIILYKFAFKNINCLFFQNTENMQFFNDNKIAMDKHRLIPGSGVNLQHFHMLEYPSDEVIEFVFISRIMKEKGIEEYLDAAKYIRNRYPNTKFHICGFCEEAYEDKLKEMQDNGIIEYHGMKRDVRSILERTHCLVHPSYHEGMANALLESASSCRPVIASNINGCKETFDEGISGYGFEVKNTDDLIKKLIKFIELPYEKKKTMGLAGRKKMEQEYSRNIVINAYIEEIEKICGKLTGGKQYVTI